MEMGSADSAGSSTTHSGVSSSCGLVVGSLLSNSCRGRAESFARRLHRRLTSLGGEVATAGNTTSDDEEQEAAMNATSIRSSSMKSPNEKSWLHSPSQRATSNNSGTLLSSTARTLQQTDDRVLDSQPRHSRESDIFYDFHPDDQQDEGTGGGGGDDDDSDDNDDNDDDDSPAEMADNTDVASIHATNNRRKGHNYSTRESVAPRPPEFLQDSETGCVFSSPLAGTSPDTDDNSEIFFDPESSETEKTCGSDREAATETSETITAPFNVIPNDESSKAIEIIRKFPVRRRIRRDIDSFENREQRENSSESSSSVSSSAVADPACNPAGIDLVDSPVNHRCNAQLSSEESLDGNKSSLETTSPSHESLWSTFDDSSTVSLEDEASCVIFTNPQPTILPKSYSDSEIIGNTSSRLNVDEVDLVIMTNGDSRVSTAMENNRSTCRSNIDITGSLDSSSGKRIATLQESVKNEVNLRIDEAANGSERGMSRLLVRLACNPNVDKIEIDDDETEEEEEEEKEVAAAVVVVVKGTNGTRKDDKYEETNETKGEDDEDEEGDEKPQRVRRCSSLKTGKTPPGTPGRKKIVRFADVLGLDLADVRTFLDEIPKIPNSAYSDLIYDEAFQKDSSPVNFWGTGPATFTTPLYAATMPRPGNNGLRLDRTLVPLFQQPGGSANFLDLVRERHVCLENVLVQDPVNMCLQGTVRVRNLDFHKSVHVRYSLDSWRNFSDVQAVYVSNSCDGFSDKFTFVLYCHTLKVGQRLELAVRFQCKGTQYWDNNAGVNYCFQCLPATPANPGYMPIITSVSTVAPSTGVRTHHEWSPAFY